MQALSIHGHGAGPDLSDWEIQPRRPPPPSRFWTGFTAVEIGL